MKRCPKCSQAYTDETLNFCLEDGEWLIGDAIADDPPTAVLSGEDAATRPWVAYTGGSTRPTSSAEYIVGEVKRHKMGVFAGAVLLIAGLIGAGWWISGRMSTRSDPAPPKEYEFVRLTSGGKVGDEPIVGGTTISPDGRYVVFWTNGGPGKSSIWLRQVSSTNSLQRILGPFEGEQNGSTFSKNGEQLYFVRIDDANPQGALFQIPLLGNVPPRRVLEWVSSPVTFSPDEKEVAFVREDRSKGESSLVVANADGSGEPRTLATRKLPEFFSSGGPSWSPDGKVIACGADTITASVQSSVVEVSASDGPERVIAQAKWGHIARVLWLPDGSGLVADGYATRAIGTQIWHISYPEGNVRRITNDLNGYGQVSLGLTADGNTIATVQEDFSQPIFAAFPNEDPGRARQVSHGKYDGMISVDTTRDGRIVYIDRTTEGSDIWIMNGDGSEKKQLTHDESLEFAARVSPDGRYVAFASIRSGTPNIWRIDIDGGNPRQITEGGGLDDGPTFSPDGKWIVFESLRSGPPTLWKVRVDGGQPLQLTNKPSGGAAISPDGTLIACILFDEKSGSGTALGLLPFDGGEIVKTLDMPATFAGRAGLTWTPDGRAITHIDAKDGYPNIVSQPIGGGPAKPLTSFKDRGYPIFNFAWTRDGKQLIYSRGPFTDDIVLIKDFR